MATGEEHGSVGETCDGAPARSVFVRSIYPAPYRTAVFENLSRTYRMFVAFEKSSDRERNDQWFDIDFTFDAVTLNSRVGRKRYRNELKRLSAYSCVLTYDYASIGSMLLMMRCLWQEVPYFINCDGAVPTPRRLRDVLKRFFIKRAAVCLAGSESAARYFGIYGATVSQIHRHPFTSLAKDDIFLEPPRGDERRRLRGELGLPSSPVIFASVGGFIPRKGFDVLLSAWLNMPPDACLVLIGEGPGEESYRSFVAKNHLRNVVIVPFQDSVSLRAYYRAADVFVLATREDIWGLVINEAMSCGLPVIVTDRCMAGVELIVDGEGGFVVPSGRPDRLESAMRLMVNIGSTERAEIGRRNLQRISSYTYEAVAAAHAVSVESICTSSNGNEQSAV